MLVGCLRSVKLVKAVRLRFPGNQLASRVNRNLPGPLRGRKDELNTCLGEFDNTAYRDFRGLRWYEIEITFRGLAAGLAITGVLRGVAQIVLLTLLEEGQQATVLQLPVTHEGARTPEPKRQSFASGQRHEREI